MLTEVIVYFLLNSLIKTEKITLLSKTDSILPNFYHNYFIDIKNLKLDDYMSLIKSILSIKVTTTSFYPNPLILLTKIN